MERRNRKLNMFQTATNAAKNTNISSNERVLATAWSQLQIRGRNPK